MSERLLPCGACLRHVRCSELVCPFYGAAGSKAEPPSTEPFRRLAAAAAVAASVASLSSSGSGCGTSGTLFYGSAGIPIAEDAGGGDAEAPSGALFYGSAPFDNGITCK